MRSKKITKDVLEKMIAMRKSGASYPKIREAFGISQWTCVHYLKDVDVGGKSQNEEEWLTVEREAAIILKERGFTHILDLNAVSNSPYWDYYAERDGERWLIDVTINSNKNVAGKVLRMLDKFKGAVLYKKNGDWSLVEISLTEL